MGRAFGAAELWVRVQGGSGGVCSFGPFFGRLGPQRPESPSAGDLCIWQDVEEMYGSLEQLLAEEQARLVDRSVQQLNGHPSSAPRSILTLCLPCCTAAEPRAAAWLLRRRQFGTRLGISRTTSSRPTFRSSSRGLRWQWGSHGRPSGS